MNFTEHYDMFLNDEHELLRKTVRACACGSIAQPIASRTSGCSIQTLPKPRQGE